MVVTSMWNRRSARADVIVKEERHTSLLPMLEETEDTTFDTLSAIFTHRTSQYPVFDQRRSKQLRDVGVEKQGR
jgi:hypothetical protein